MTITIFGNVQNVVIKTAYRHRTSMNPMMITKTEGERQITIKELKERVDKLMRQYADEKIDGVTYAQKMMELTTSTQNGTDSSVSTSGNLQERDSGDIKKSVGSKT